MRVVRAHVFIGGFVQGVFFRAHTRAQAESLRVRGWVRNLQDGTVEAVFEGEEEDVKKLIAWCHKGPPESRVESVSVEWEQPRGEPEQFRIIR